MKYCLGICGTGTMGQAIMSRIVEENILKPSDIILYDIDKQKLNSLADRFGIADHPQQIADDAKYILFAVKPQHFHSVCENVIFHENNVLISIMAGVSVKKLRSSLNYPCPIVRVMPNTPCKLGKGVMGVFADGTGEEDKNTIIRFLSACGKVILIEEKYFDAVTSVSGSGPAYVYMFLQGMIQGGMEGGLTFEQSKALAIQTMIGTAEMVKTSDEPIDILIDKVCSKGGTTIEAVNCYRQNKLVETIAMGIEKCRLRSQELGK